MQFRFRGASLICGILAALASGAFAAQAKTRNPLNRPGKPFPAIAAGAITDGLYRNPSFNFSYKPPYGWVDRTDRMRDDSDDPSKGLVLLAVFERPPEASGTTINSAVLIAAESASSYSGLKTAADYFGPLEEVTAAKGFKALNDPYEFSVGTKQLARADFSKEIGQSTAHQTSLVMLQKGYVVSFTFIGESEDEVEKLLEGLSFGAAQKASPYSSTTHSSAPKK
jgi:hypothetical protein